MTSIESRSSHALALSLWLESWVESNVIPGAVLGLYNSNGEEIFYHECEHLSKEEENQQSSQFSEDASKVQKSKKFTKDSIFRIYSMTKPITAVAASILMERGLLSLDDEVSKYIPSFAQLSVLVGGTLDKPLLEPLKKPMTIYHLLTHTSGISYGIFSNSIFDQLLRRHIGENSSSIWFRDVPLSELCDKIAQTPLCFHPGDHFLYGLSSDVLGYIIEVISGKSLQSFFFEEIFE